MNQPGVESSDAVITCDSLENVSKRLSASVFNTLSDNDFYMARLAATLVDSSIPGELLDEEGKTEFERTTNGNKQQS